MSDLIRVFGQHERSGDDMVDSTARMNRCCAGAPCRSFRTVSAWILLIACLIPITIYAAFPGANGRIAFISNRDGNQEIYVMNADGSGQTRLTFTSAHEDTPKWSPDGTKIVFSSNRDGDSEIFVMNADGTNVVQLTFNSAEDFQPAWSPDGTKIVFGSNRDGNDEIYVMNADGSNQINLTNNAAGDVEPEWSPDGTKIAFQSLRTAGTAQIHVMNPDGTGQTNISNSGVNDGGASWSPDGTRIAFHSGGAGVQIFVMNADGTGRTMLTNNSGELPAWSPDGTKIVFDTGRDGNFEVYVMNADGTNQTNLTNFAAAFDARSDWQPQTLPVAIDIKPGSFPNSINPKSKGKIPVAILSTANFNAPASVDMTSLTFGRSGNEASLAFCNTSGEDVNGDFLADLVCHFDTQKAAFQAGDTEGLLKGKTTTATPLAGSDSVRIVP